MRTIPGNSYTCYKNNDREFSMPYEAYSADVNHENFQ